MRHSTLFLTQRSERQQQNALAAAPATLDITMRRDPPRAEILRWLPQMEFLVSERAGVIDAEMIAAGKKLKLIQRLGSQAWDIDLEAARRAGIPVCYLPLATCQLVAEHLVLQMLATAKRVRELMQVVAEAGDWGVSPRRCTEDYYVGNWSRRENIRGLRQSTVGIIGFGEIGVELARRLRPFNCVVLYNKRMRLPANAETELGISYATKEDLLMRSDFVCSLLPLTPETEQSVNANSFATMKRGAIFVHCGAGAVVDETALIDALRSGELAGAALDTYTYEPMRPDDPLLELARDPMQNLILTPSIAAGTPITAGHPRAGDYANIVAMLEGKPLEYRLV
jgi:phosphoglycerate dehydrogenase-like enzyme